MKRADAMREIVLDTETTGLTNSDRIVEIGCVELINGSPAREFHVYINPEMRVPDEAIRVHGITNEFLRGKPLFADVVQDFLNFIGKDALVIHNASFDVRMLNNEFGKLNLPKIDAGRLVVDTMKMARAKWPGKSSSLDSVLDRLGVDRSDRNVHGALIDSQLLARAYSLLRVEQKKIEINSNTGKRSDLSATAVNRGGIKKLPVIVLTGEDVERNNYLFRTVLKNDGGVIHAPAPAALVADDMFSDLSI